MADRKNNKKMEICPWCGEFRRNSEDPLCRGCNSKFNKRVEEAEIAGEIFLRTRSEFARMKGEETQAQFEKEFQLAQKQKEEFYPKARDMVMAEFRDTPAVSVNRTEFNRQVSRKFGELLGDQNRSNEIWEAINSYSDRIASLERFFAYEPETVSMDEEEKPAA